MIKRTLILFSILFCTLELAFAQSDFEKYKQEQQQKLGAYQKENQENFNRYKDSLNQKYAEYLAKQWQSFNLLKQDPPLKNPIPQPPVFDTQTPIPEPVEIPVVKPQPAPKPPPTEEPKPLPPPPAPIDNYPLKTVFFGTNISLKDIPKQEIRLYGVSEKDIADYWKALASLPFFHDWEDEALRLKSDLKLNEWALYLLINKLFSVYFPKGNENEQVIFLVFILNQLGYRAKIGFAANELVPLIVFQNEVYNTPYFTNKDLGIKYSVVYPKHKELTSLKSCPMDYEGAKYNINMNIAETPCFALNLQTKILQGNQLHYNKNVVDFYETFPCVEFPVYAEAPIDETSWKSIEAQIAPAIKNKSQEEAVNWLLDFVQNVFQYKTDEEQYGYEKWNFAEETIASDFSDCDDRAILFAQFVRRLLDMPVVLVYYTNIHLATAVKFNNIATTGDYFMIDGEKYLICDPTYINAKLGMAMPSLRNIPVEIIKLKP